ncbi:Shedu immune nuclease family protein [Vibrio cyclitrophicus]
MKSGLRSGKSTYVKVEEGRASAVSKITSISDEDLDEILSISNGDAFKTVKKIASILTNSNHSDAILNSLKQLPVHDIAKLNAMTGITTLKASLDYWKQNDKSKDEGQWQKYFENNPFILSNILSIPAFMLNGGAYVGGKSADNAGGNLCDFLFKSERTENPVLIEIKTPATNLIGKAYRQTFSMSDEVSGSIGQILNYSNQLLKNSYALQVEGQDKSKEQQYKIHKPLLYVIVGNSTELDNNKKREAFELYRNNLKDINILTFDEVFAKVERLISALEESTNS